MINLGNLIKPESIICDIEIKSKKRALEVLAEHLSKESNSEIEMTDEDNALTIFELLVEREKLGSTGLGHGVALPHARSDLTAKAVASFIKLDKGIDFDSPDQEATDLIFALMVPAESTDEHLQILSHLAGLFSDHDFCQSLRDSSDENDIYQKLVNWQITSQAS